MEIKRGQVIYIRDKKHYVDKYFITKTDIGTSYTISMVEVETSKNIAIKVKEVNGEMSCYLLFPFSRTVHPEDETIHLRGEKFTRIAVDKNPVKNGESTSYAFAEYDSEDGKKEISYYKTGSRVIINMGALVDPSYIKITNEIDPTYEKGLKELKMFLAFSFMIIVAAVLLYLAFVCVRTGIIVIPSGNKIDKHCKKDNYYELVDEIKNTSSHSKANVYKTKYPDMDTCVKDIITNMPNHIKKVNDAESVQGIAVETAKEYAYVYEEEGVVYIQVCGKDFLKDKSGVTVYHNNHLNGYLAGYRYQSKSSYYTNYINEVKKQNAY